MGTLWNPRWGSIQIALHPGWRAIALTLGYVSQPRWGREIVIVIVVSEAVIVFDFRLYTEW